MNISQVKQLQYSLSYTGTILHDVCTLEGSFITVHLLTMLYKANLHHNFLLTIGCITVGIKVPMTLSFSLNFIKIKVPQTMFLQDILLLTLFQSFYLALKVRIKIFVQAAKGLRP